MGTLAERPSKARVSSAGEQHPQREGATIDHHDSGTETPPKDMLEGQAPGQPRLPDSQYDVTHSGGGVNGHDVKEGDQPAHNCSEEGIEPDVNAAGGSVGERGQEPGPSYRGDLDKMGDREQTESRGGGVNRHEGEKWRARRHKRNAESSDWRRGKRDRTENERDPRSSSPTEGDERSRKRRKSGDLPLSPNDMRFQMGAQERSGSPKFERDHRRSANLPRRTPSEEDQRATLYVGDIDAQTSKRDLRRVFERFGDVKEAKMITGQCYGFVTFRSRTDAETALQSADSIDILGRKPYMSWAQGALPAWKIGVGGFMIDPRAGIIDKRDALSKAAEVAAATAAAVLAKKTDAEQHKGASVGGRRLVAYDDLF